MSKPMQFFFLCLGHFYVHLFMLVFATVAALTLSREWGLPYAALVPYATPGFVAFGLCSFPAGWLADKWSRQGMMIIFFIGIGLSSITTALAATPFQIGVGLLAIGVFAAIYHPVGLALVVQGRRDTGLPLAVNGIFGNMGVACAALITGFLIDYGGWRFAYVWPGVASVSTGGVYAWLLHRNKALGVEPARQRRPGKQLEDAPGPACRSFGRIFAVILISTALGGVIFQSTTFALPKVLAERLTGSATIVGRYAFIVFAAGALGQLGIGYLVDRYPIRYVFALVTAFQAVFFILMPGTTGWGALVLSMGFMLVVFGQIPINDVLVGRITQREWRSRIFALRYVVTFTVMASSVPLIAFIHKGYGFDSLFRLLSAAAVCAFFTVLTLPARLPGKGGGLKILTGNLRK